MSEALRKSFSNFSSDGIYTVNSIKEYLEPNRADETIDFDFSSELFCFENWIF